MTDAMKSCPFCGGHEIGHIETKGGGLVIVCGDCGARGPDYVVGDPEREETWREAYAAWNKRA